MARVESTLPRVRPQAVFVAFVLAVGVVLNGLSQLGTLASAAWMALAWPVLAVMALFSAGRLAGARSPARRGHARAHAARLALAVGAMAALPAIGVAADLADVVRFHARLHDAAWAPADRPGPHLAAIQTGDFLGARWGYLYDDSGEVTRPCGTQSDRWLANAARTGVAERDLCSEALTHVIGPYYRWAE